MKSTPRPTSATSRARPSSPSDEITRDQWLRALNEARHQYVKLPPGKGWKTIAEIGALLGLSRCPVQRIVCDRKAFERFQGLVYNESSGRFDRRIWFRPIKR